MTEQPQCVPAIVEIDPPALRGVASCANRGPADPLPSLLAQAERVAALTLCSADDARRGIAAAFAIYGNAGDVQVLLEEFIGCCSTLRDRDGLEPGARSATRAVTRVPL